MKKSKEFNQALKEFNTESKTLGWCVNHFPFAEFLKSLKGSDTNLAEVKKLLSDKNSRFAFLSFCVNQEKFYVLLGSSLHVYNDKKNCSLNTVRNIVITLCLLSDKESNEKIITGYQKGINEAGKEVNRPVFENKTQIGFITLVDLWKAASITKAA